jgi:murein DD-endopeptidase MepM/ murein hydrolase activator NlpD
MTNADQLAAFLNAHPEQVSKVVDFDPLVDRLYRPDLTEGNSELDYETIADTARFSQWIDEKLSSNNCRYGIGGFLENRTIYAHSLHFGAGTDARTLHLGVDIWGGAGTAVYCPLPGKIHSFKDNNNLGDYGPTIIIAHDLNGLQLHTLYGHLSRKSLDGIEAGQVISAGGQIAELGNATENGQWPPHLHFQLMFDMEGKAGDYPGVCSPAEKATYLQNTADPQLLLKLPEPVNAWK